MACLWQKAFILPRPSSRAEGSMAKVIRSQFFIPTAIPAKFIIVNFKGHALASKKFHLLSIPNYKNWTTDKYFWVIKTSLWTPDVDVVINHKKFQLSLHWYNARTSITVGGSFNPFLEYLLNYRMNSEKILPHFQGEKRSKEESHQLKLGMWVN